MAQWIVIVLIKTVIVWTVIECLAPNEQCISLDGFVGRCIKLSKCESLFDIWQSSVRSIQQSERLADSLCGRYKTNPLVCCIGVQKDNSDGNHFSYTKPWYSLTTSTSRTKPRRTRTSTSTTKLTTTPKTTVHRTRIATSATRRSSTISVPTSTPRASTTKYRKPTSTTKRPPTRRIYISTSRTSTRSTRTSTSTTRRNPKTTATTTTSKPIVSTSSSEVSLQQTSLDEFPWSALIRYRKSPGVYGFHCGATLIHERYVVTAAHCVRAVPRSWEISRIRLGDYDTTSEAVDCLPDKCADPHLDVDVEQIVVHENYVTRHLSQYNDIALIRLAAWIEPTDFIRPISLPFSGIENVLLDQPKTVVSAGWGRTKTGFSSTVKMKVKLNMEDLNSCAASYKVAGVKLRDTQLCASEWRGTGVCSCDSGGPMMVKLSGQYYLVGIVSFGPAKCGLKNAPGVYTSVIKFSTWIWKNMY